MDIPWGLITFVVGLLYGLMAPGKQNKLDILKRGLLMAVVLALIIAIIGWLADVDVLGPVNAAVAFLGMVLLFIIGVWLGDLLESGIRGSDAP